MAGAYLIRLAETGREPHRQRRKLRADVAAAVADRVAGATVKHIATGRLLVVADTDATAALAGVHGIVSYSPCRRCPLEALDDTVAELAANLAPRASFRVLVKRVGSHPFTSQQLAARLSEQIRAAREDLRLDLDAAAVTVGVEVRSRACFVFDRVIPGLDRRHDLAPPPLRGPRFLVDQMLRPLATWLRLCGFDTDYVYDRADSELLRRARAERRLILTRDRELADTPSANTLFVHATDLDGQLDEVLSARGLRVDPTAVFTRCTVCNTPVVPVDADAVADRLPPGIAEAHDRFTECESCGRVYWPGEHYQRILERLRQLGR